jgi:hypothetical protein
MRSFTGRHAFRGLLITEYHPCLLITPPDGESTRQHGISHQRLIILGGD